ncbi:MAG: ATP-binding protein, partial [Mycobacterium sp.]|nr:ATP-binding protein [Mycobacterium sp.]
MTLLRKTAEELGVADPDSLVEQLLEQMLITRGHRASPSEQQSWRRSLPTIASDLRSAGLGDVEMLVEYHLPLTSQRADVVLAGVHPTTGQPSYVVIELKQWSAATMFEGDPELVTVPGMGGGPRLHPVRQVLGYCSYLADFVRAFADQPDALAGAAYLHNATDTAAVADLSALPVSTTGRLFTAANRGEFTDFLRTRLAPASGAAAADTLLRSAIAPSRQLLKVAADEVRDRERFHLLGDQQAAVQTVHHAVRQAHAGNSKRIVVVTGGPGSGKSVISLSLL